MMRADLYEIGKLTRIVDGAEVTCMLLASGENWATELMVGGG